MFTGIVEEVGIVRGLSMGERSARITLEAPVVASDTRVSDSVCTNGVCLTVTEISGGLLSFDAVPETMQRSSLGDLREGSRVNLERSLAVGQRLGGHFVQGHVDATAELLSIEEIDNSREITFAAPPEFAPYLVEKGSVALDGISLTLARAEGSRFTVAIIPFTWEHTNLSERRVGDRVNLEVDILGKYILHALNCYGPGAGLTGAFATTTESVLRP